MPSHGLITFLVLLSYGRLWRETIRNQQHDTSIELVFMCCANLRETRYHVVIQKKSGH